MKTSIANQTAGAAALCIFLFALAVTSADAALVERLGGTAYYDTELDITWLGDATYSVTEFDENPGRIDEIISAVGTVAGHTLTRADYIHPFDNNVHTGRMTWWGATSWADQLVFGGSDNWRLPHVDIDGDGDKIVCSEVSIEKCLDNEFSYLYYEDGVTVDTPTPFADVENMHYWSSDPVSEGVGWGFQMRSGRQTESIYQDMYLAWAVTDGDVAPVPVPPALWLLGSGLLTLLAAGRRKISCAK